MIQLIATSAEARSSRSMLAYCSSSKIRTRLDLAQVCRRAKRESKRVCLASGVFDLLHVGHINYLEAAKAQAELLLVGVNSDASVRKIKGLSRPIVPEHERAQLIGALGCVDYVFIFGETTSRVSVGILKPDVYAKGGDYIPQALSAYDLLAKSGAEIFIADYTTGLSSTSLVERAANSFFFVPGSDSPSQPKGPAVFLDRDGTINELVDYLCTPGSMRLLTGAARAIRAMREGGFRIVVVTNQPGIGLGYFSREEFFLANKPLLAALSEQGAYIDRFYFCPHSAANQCQCRKPGTELLNRAAQELNIDLPASFMIGDMTSDIQAGKNSGCSTILVKTGRGGQDGVCDVEPDFVAESLFEASSLVLQFSSPAVGREREENTTSVRSALR